MLLLMLFCEYGYGYEQEQELGELIEKFFLRVFGVVGGIEGLFGLFCWV